MAGSKIWSAEDRTGGPLDDILDAVRAAIPKLHVERLVGTWPADDDNVYWLQHEGREVQVDTQDDGRLPTTIEVDDRRLDTSTVTAAVSFIVKELSARTE